MNKNKMTIEEALNLINNAVEYYEMNHDAGNENETKENIQETYDALDVIKREVNND